ncbi:MAG: hypothetical protein NUV91_01700 [Candidatus Omnitrophica bacterium]|nr:hypothetical protein [Candidatus Omnitrophota bacterium]
MNIKQFLIIFLIFIFFSIGYYRWNYGFYPIPNTFRGLVHVLNMPSDLYDPIILDDFKFSEVNYSKTYDLNPKYLDQYVLGVINTIDGIPEYLPFTGELKLEFFYKNKIIYQQIDSGKDICWLLNNQNGRRLHKSVYLSYFNLPLLGKYKNHLKLKVTVLKSYLEKGEDRVTNKLFIAVSAKP